MSGLSVSQGVIAKLDLKHGDILVLKIDALLSGEQQERAKRWVKDTLVNAGHGNHEILILGRDMSLEVIAKART